MSIAARVRCTSYFRSTGIRCTRYTYQGHKCASHLLAEDGLMIKQSTIPNSGKGLFTAIARRKGDRLAPYTGQRITLENPDITYGGPYVLQLSRTQFIDAAHTSSGAGRYSNTCRMANVKRGEARGNNAGLVLDRSKKAVWIVASRKILAGQEIFTAYGHGYWR